jgi:hypothetical protein
MKILLLIFFSSFAFSRDHTFVRDPENLMGKVDKFVGWTTFEDTFKCGTKIIYEMNQCARRCEPYFCKEICHAPEQSIVTVEDCNKEGATLMSKGKVWIKVSRSRFRDYNFIRAWLGIPKSGPSGKGPGEEIGKSYVTLKNIELEKFTLLNRKVLESLRLHVIYSHWDNDIGEHIHSHQSIVVGKAHETVGLHLEHKFHEVDRPVGRVLTIDFPK